MRDFLISQQTRGPVDLWRVSPSLLETLNPREMSLNYILINYYNYVTRGLPLQVTDYSTGKCILQGKTRERLILLQVVSPIDCLVMVGPSIVPAHSSCHYNASADDNVCGFEWIKNHQLPLKVSSASLGSIFFSLCML